MSGSAPTNTAPPSNAGTALTREELERWDVDDLDRLAFGVACGDRLTVDPDRLRLLYPDDLANPQALFDAQGMAWAWSVSTKELVSLSVDDLGRLCLEDGHHRWLAAKKTGRTLSAEITAVKGRPIERILARQAETAAGEEPPRPRRARPRAGR